MVSLISYTFFFSAVPKTIPNLHRLVGTEPEKEGIVSIIHCILNTIKIK